MTVDVDHRLVYHELYEKLLYMFTDLDYMMNMNDEKIEEILHNYGDLLTFDNDNFHSFIIYYFFDFTGNEYLPLSQADRNNDKYYKVLSKIIVQGNIDNLIEMTMDEIIIYFNTVFSYYYDDTFPQHIIMYISEECIRELEDNKDLTTKFKIYIMEQKLKNH